MGAAEVALAVSSLLGLVCALGAFIARGAIGDGRATERRTCTLELEVAVLKTTVPDHGARLSALEVVIGELKGDLREVKGDMHRVARWVDMQADPGRHRRKDDVDA